MKPQLARHQLNAHETRETALSWYQCGWKSFRWKLTQTLVLPKTYSPQCVLLCRWKTRDRICEITNKSIKTSDFFQIRSKYTPIFSNFFLSLIVSCRRQQKGCVCIKQDWITLEKKNSVSSNQFKPINQRGKHIDHWWIIILTKLWSNTNSYEQKIYQRWGR